MRYQKLCWALLCLIVCSCNSSKQSKERQEIAPEYKRVVCSFDGGETISRLFISESNIVALTLQEPFFSCINIEEKKVISSFGRKGRAGGELLGIPQGVNIRKGQLQFMDYASKSLISISVDDGEMHTRPVPYTMDFRPLRMVEVGGKMIAIGGFRVGRIAFVNQGGEIVFGEEYPFDTGVIAGILRGAVIQSDIVAAPDRPMVMIRTMASDCFEIYQVTDNGIQRVFVNDYKNLPVIEKNTFNPRKSKAGYIRSYVDNDHIYLMYSSSSYQEASNEGLLSNIIHMFDWDGNLSQIIHLPDRVGAFCVKESLLFGAIEFPDHTEIVAYEIS